MKIHLLLLLAFSNLIFISSKSQNYIFKEDFNNNINEWKMYDTPYRYSKIENGLFIGWNGNANSGSSDCINIKEISFDNNSDYTIEVSIANFNNMKGKAYLQYEVDKNGEPKKAKKSIDNPIWGFVWGYKDNNNFNSIIFQGVQGEYSSYKKTSYIIYSKVSGNDIIHEAYTDINWASFNEESGFNILKIEKRDGKFSIYGGSYGSKYLGSCNLAQWYGNGIGSFAGPGAKVVLDYLYITSSSVTSNLKKTTAKYSSWDSYRLKKHFTSNSLDNIEGIWEDFDLNIDNSKMKYSGNYKLGVVKSNEGYDLIYLSGDKDNSNTWKDGMLKGRIIKTGSEGLMKLEWYSSDLFIYENVYVYLDENNLLNFAFKDKNSSTKMLKLFPTNNSNTSSGSSNSDDYTSSGSGIILNTKGYIATNYHVVKDAKSILVQVTQNGKVKKYNAKVVVSDKTNDLSVLQISDVDFTGFGAIPFAVKNTISDVGTNVFAMGYPMSSYLGEEVKVTDGLISSKTGYQGDIVTYQISVPIQPGNSGGPLFDKQGNLIGITNAGIPSAENVGYAIKTSYLKNLIEVAPENIVLPTNNTISSLSFTEKIKILSKFVVFIKVKE